MTVLLGLGLVGLVGPEGPSGTLGAWDGDGLGVMLGGLDLGIGSGLDSSVSAGTAGWMSDLAAGKRYRQITGCYLLWT